MTMPATAAEDAEDRMAAIESRLNLIVEELGHLKQVRTGAEDLIADLRLVAKDALGDATAACGTMDLRAQEIVRLLRTTLVDAQLLTAAVQQLESAADFIKDAQIVARDLYQQASAGCQTLEQRGYFKAAAAGLRVGDKLVQSCSSSDLKQVEDSVPQLVGFLRELMRTESLQMLGTIVHSLRQVQASMNVNKSIFQLVRDMNSPDARRGIAMMIEFLKVVGSSSAAIHPAGACADTER